MAERARRGRRCCVNQRAYAARYGSTKSTHFSLRIMPRVGPLLRNFDGEACQGTVRVTDFGIRLGSVLWLRLRRLQAPQQHARRLRCFSRVVASLSIAHEDEGRHEASVNVIKCETHEPRSILPSKSGMRKLIAHNGDQIWVRRLILRVGGEEMPEFDKNGNTSEKRTRLI